jgi:hypothetical protein
MDVYTHRRGVVLLFVRSILFKNKPSGPTIIPRHTAFLPPSDSPTISHTVAASKSDLIIAMNESHMLKEKRYIESVN